MASCWKGMCGCWKHGLSTEPWESAVQASVSVSLCVEWVASYLAAWPWVAEAAPLILGLRRGCSCWADGSSERTRR